MIVLAVQISTLMDKYDQLWIDFHEVESRAVAIDPSLYESLDYSMWMSCCLLQIPV